MVVFLRLVSTFFLCVFVWENHARWLVSLRRCRRRHFGETKKNRGRPSPERYGCTSQTAAAQTGAGNSTTRSTQTPRGMLEEGGCHGRGCGSGTPP